MSIDLTPLKAILVAGAEIVGRTVVEHEFVFEYRGGGRGSGGDFVCGEFVRGDRRIELHFRGSLGLVKYHLGNLCASHEAYMRELGVLGKNQYPGFSSDPLQGFRNLAHDLSFASDFVSGDAAVFREAAIKDAEAIAQRSKDLMSGYVGDNSQLEKMQKLFRLACYADVLAVFEKLKYQDRLTNAQKEMVRIARERAGPQETGGH